MGNHGPLAGSDDAVAFYNLHIYECFLLPLHSLASSKVILWPSKVHLSWSFLSFIELSMDFEKYKLNQELLK